MSRPKGGYIVGATVTFELRIAKPGTKTPYDPATVIISSMTLNGVAVTIPGGGVFTKISQGDWTYNMDTSSLAPGTYKVTMKMSDGPTATVLLSDSFVLNAP